MFQYNHSVSRSTIRAALPLCKATESLWNKCFISTDAARPQRRADRWAICLRKRTASGRNLGERYFVCLVLRILWIIDCARIEGSWHGNRCSSFFQLPPKEVEGRKLTCKSPMDSGLFKHVSYYKIEVLRFSPYWIAIMYTIVQKRA